jgi:hypothetical protein
MRATVKAGLLLGILVVLWTFVMGFTGWYKHPTLLNLFWGVIAIQIGVMIWGLKLTAVEGYGYGKQIGAGLLISLIGGVIIFAGSIVFTNLVFPQYFQELEILGREVMKTQGKSEAEINAYLAQLAPTQTSFRQALFGFIGTVATGLVASLAIGIFLRKK